MSINCNCEFGYELQLVIPYAYFLYKNNLLNKTTSSFMTKELYYFSKNHEEKYIKRTNNLDCLLNVPNKTPHKKELTYDQYTPPPYKSEFKNNFFIYDKPLLIIHNKFNEEWDAPPINFIDTNTLNEIFNLCNTKYKIIYIRPQCVNIITDNSDIYNLNENDLFILYDIIDGNILYNECKEKYNINNFNHFQLLIHANCDNFISVQGGNSVLASYFGGINIIYSKQGNELCCDAYNGHYKKYSNCNILHSNNYTEFIELIKTNFLDSK
jgi:hypothetical protein